MTKLVISATNLVEGGGLRVLRDCVDAAARRDDVETIVIVHDRSLLSRDDVTIIEMPEVKRSWLRRVDAEYRRFRSLSRRLRPDVWLSLHDISPNVAVGRQYVYCHNPAPFYRASWRQMWHEPPFAAFNLLYGLLYRINIGRNDAVIVQQDWLRREFQRFGARRVITAAPHKTATRAVRAANPGRARRFLYPALPRSFKNHEVICRAVEVLEREPGWDAEVRFTISGEENRYARWIAGMARDLRSIELIGRQDQTAMRREYQAADVILFPSTLETWGLPISEGKEACKTLFLADLPYAHETLGRYESATFIAPTDAAAWARAMRAATIGDYHFATIGPEDVRPPDMTDWAALIDYVVAPGDASAKRGT